MYAGPPQQRGYSIRGLQKRLIELEFLAIAFDFADNKINDLIRSL
jgi:hypothetical protein